MNNEELNNYYVNYVKSLLGFPTQILEKPKQFIHQNIQEQPRQLTSEQQKQVIPQNLTEQPRQLTSEQPKQLTSEQPRQIIPQNLTEQPNQLTSEQPRQIIPQNLTEQSSLLTSEQQRQVIPQNLTEQPRQISSEQPRQVIPPENKKSKMIVFTTHKPNVGDIVNIPNDIPFYKKDDLFSNNPQLLGSGVEMIAPTNFFVKIEEGMVRHHIGSNTDYDLTFNSKNLLIKNKD